MKRHMTAATTGATRIGVVSSVRTSPIPGRSRKRKTQAASRKPTTISTDSAMAAKESIRPIAVWNRLERNR